MGSPVHRPASFFLARPPVPQEQRGRGRAHPRRPGALLRVPGAPASSGDCAARAPPYQHVHRRTKASGATATADGARARLGQGRASTGRRAWCAGEAPWCRGCPLEHLVGAGEAVEARVGPGPRRWRPGLGGDRRARRGERGCPRGARERGGSNRGEREGRGGLKWARPQCIMGSVHGRAQVSSWREKEGEGGRGLQCCVSWTPRRPRGTRFRSPRSTGGLGMGVLQCRRAL